jgi:hypothetical protein
MSGSRNSRYVFISAVASSSPLTFFGRIVEFRREVFFKRGNPVSDPEKNGTRIGGSQQDVLHLCGES